MTFWEHFLRLLPIRPARALGALYWHITRRKVRARNRLRVASADLPFAYDFWIGANEPDRETSDGFAAFSEQWEWRPRISVLLYSSPSDSVEQRNRSIHSIERQVFPVAAVVNAQLDQISTAIVSLDQDYVVPVRAGDELSEMAIFRFAEALQSNREAAILYGDEDRIDRKRRRTCPWFKPRWNEELFLAQDYLSSAAAIEMALAHEIALKESPATVPELVLSAAMRTNGPIVHVPHIVSHISATRPVQKDRLEAVTREVQRVGATCTPGPFGTTKVIWPLPKTLPLVSIIVPTRDKLELLQPCIESVLDRTNYEPIEILLVDNDSVEPRTTEYLNSIAKDERVKVLPYPHRYNFSAINNFAVRHAEGSFICLLNNDTEVIGRDWLTEMMRYAVRPEVGAVGAKLLYDDGTIQHAGVIVGIGEAAGHAHRFLPGHDPGYFLQPHISQFVTAVTAACLVVAKEKFNTVGGLDEEGLEIAFNDVDLCLKLQRAGWRNVYVPHATLVHHESKSRGSDLSPKNIDRYHRELRVLQERWKTKSYQDPLHNPNLDRYSETFVFRI